MGTASVLDHFLPKRFVKGDLIRGPQPPEEGLKIDDYVPFDRPAAPTSPVRVLPGVLRRSTVPTARVTNTGHVEPEEPVRPVDLQLAGPETEHTPGTAPEGFVYDTDAVIAGLKGLGLAGTGLVGGAPVVSHDFEIPKTDGTHVVEGHIFDTNEKRRFRLRLRLKVEVRDGVVSLTQRPEVIQIEQFAEQVSVIDLSSEGTTHTGIVHINGVMGIKGRQVLYVPAFRDGELGFALFWGTPRQPLEVYRVYEPVEPHTEERDEEDSPPAGGREYYPGVSVNDIEYLAAGKLADVKKVGSKEPNNFEADVAVTLKEGERKVRVHFSLRYHKNGVALKLVLDWHERAQAWIELTSGSVAELRCFADGWFSYGGHFFRIELVDGGGFMVVTAKTATPKLQGEGKVVAATVKRSPPSRSEVEAWLALFRKYSGDKYPPELRKKMGLGLFDDEGVAEIRRKHGRVNNKTTVNYLLDNSGLAYFKLAFCHLAAWLEREGVLTEVTMRIFAGAYHSLAHQRGVKQPTFAVMEGIVDALPVGLGKDLAVVKEVVTTAVWIRRFVPDGRLRPVLTGFFTGVGEVKADVLLAVNDELAESIRNRAQGPITATVLIDLYLKKAAPTGGDGEDTAAIRELYRGLDGLNERQAHLAPLSGDLRAEFGLAGDPTVYDPRFGLRAFTLEPRQDKEGRRFWAFSLVGARGHGGRDKLVVVREVVEKGGTSLQAIKIQENMVTNTAEAGRNTMFAAISEAAALVRTDIRYNEAGSLVRQNSPFIAVVQTDGKLLIVEITKAEFFRRVAERDTTLPPILTKAPYPGVELTGAAWGGRVTSINQLAGKQVHGIGAAGATGLQQALIPLSTSDGLWAIPLRGYLHDDDAVVQRKTYRSLAELKLKVVKGQQVVAVRENDYGRLGDYPLYGRYRRLTLVDERTVILRPNVRYKDDSEDATSVQSPIRITFLPSGLTFVEEISLAEFFHLYDGAEVNRAAIAARAVVIPWDEFDGYGRPKVEDVEKAGEAGGAGAEGGEERGKGGAGGEGGEAIPSGLVRVDLPGLGAAVYVGQGEVDVFVEAARHAALNLVAEVVRAMRKRVPDQDSRDLLAGLFGIYLDESDASDAVGVQWQEALDFLDANPDLPITEIDKNVLLMLGNMNLADTDYTRYPLYKLLYDHNYTTYEAVAAAVATHDLTNIPLELVRQALEAGDLAQIEWYKNFAGDAEMRGILANLASQSKPTPYTGHALLAARRFGEYNLTQQTAIVMLIKGVAGGTVLEVVAVAVLAALTPQT